MAKYIRIIYEGEGKVVPKGYGNCVKCGVYGKVDNHHIMTQSRGGVKTKKLCRECHIWVGNNIEKAKLLNLYIGGYNEK